MSGGAGKSSQGEVPPPPPPPSADSIIARTSNALFEALPGMKVERLTELLEFIAVQHSGSNFNPDNQSKALEIAAFCNKHSFPCSPQGVSALARVARHALGLGKGQSSSAEHQLWLLASGALNTAAAVCAHDGDAVSCFESIRTDSAVRGKFMQRIYAQHAMQDHVQNPDVCLSQETEDPDAVLIRLVSNLGPAQLFCAASALFVAIMASVILASESASASAARWLGLI